MIKERITNVRRKINNRVNFIITKNEPHQTIYSLRMVLTQLYIDRSGGNNEL